MPINQIAAMRKKPLRFILILFFLSFLFSALPILAQANDLAPVMEEVGKHNRACLDDGSCTVSDFVYLLVIAAKYIIAYSGVLALLAFVYGGILFLTSAGQADRVSKGKSIIIGSMIGLAIVFFSYTIIQFIGKNILNIDGFDISSGWF